MTGVQTCALPIYSPSDHARDIKAHTAKKSMTGQSNKTKKSYMEFRARPWRVPLREHHRRHVLLHQLLRESNKKQKKKQSKRKRGEGEPNGRADGNDKETIFTVRLTAIKARKRTLVIASSAPSGIVICMVMSSGLTSRFKSCS